MAATAVFLALDYIGGYFVFGLFYWLLGGILPDLNILTVDSDLYNWCIYLWHAALIVYIGLGIFFLFNRLKEYDVTRRL